MTVHWTPTPASSNVSAFAYDEATKTLHVKFTSGATYRYSGVEAHHEDGLTNADSAGKYLREHIIGSYDHKRS